MTKNENLRLCGGTFFTLLLEARKQLLGANEHYAGKKDGLTEYETLIGLARVIRSDLATPMPTEIKTIQGNASEYKKCKNAGGGYFPFGDKTALRVFDERVKNEYTDTLRKMCCFVDGFIDAGGDIKKDELLVKALVELISLDNCMLDSIRLKVNGLCRDLKCIKMRRDRSHHIRRLLELVQQAMEKMKVMTTSSYVYCSHA